MYVGTVPSAMNSISALSLHTQWKSNFSIYLIIGWWVDSGWSRMRMRMSLLMNRGEVMLWWSVESGMLFATTTNSVVGPTGLSTALPGMNQVE